MFSRQAADDGDSMHVNGTSDAAALIGLATATAALLPNELRPTRQLLLLFGSIGSLKNVLLQIVSLIIRSCFR